MRETANYRLGLWEAADEAGREVLNGNFAALDEALTGEAEARAAGLDKKSTVVAGAYTGDGAASRLIDLGITPKAVLIFPQDWSLNYSFHHYGGMAIQGGGTANGGHGLTTLAEGGFQVNHYSQESANYTTVVSTNSGGDVYYYWALL